MYEQIQCLKLQPKLSASELPHSLFTNYLQWTHNQYPTCPYKPEFYQPAATNFSCTDTQRSTKFFQIHHQDS